MSLGDPALAVTAGDHLDLEVVFDNATAQFGRRTLVANGMSALPANFGLVNGCLFKLSWFNNAASFASPTTVAEGSAGSNTVVPVIIGRIA